MLIDFEVENFRSYRKRKRFSMVAASSAELYQNLIQSPDLDLALVRSAVVYGPNASGKSNLLLAMDRLGALMQFSRKWELAAWSSMLPFALDEECEKKSSNFRIRFSTDGVLYDYSISVRPKFVENECLIAFPHGRPQEWFRREGSQITFNATHLRGPKQSLRSLTPEHAPLLAVASEFDHEQLSMPARWLSSSLRDRLGFFLLNSMFNSQVNGPAEATASLYQRDGAFRQWVNAFLLHADLGIEGLHIENIEVRFSEPVVQVRRTGRELPRCARPQKITRYRSSSTRDIRVEVSDSDYRMNRRGPSGYSTCWFPFTRYCAMGSWRFLMS